MIKSVRNLFILTALLLAIAAPAAAEPYLFVGTGIARAETTLVPDASGSSFMPFSIGGGYRFTPHLSAETSFFNVSRMVGKSQQGTTVTQNTWSAYGAELSIVGTVPVTQSLSLLGKAGGAFVKAQNIRSDIDTATNQFSDTTTASDGIHPSAGIGASYVVGKETALRVMAQHIDMDNETKYIRLFSVGLVVSF